MYPKNKMGLLDWGKYLWKGAKALWGLIRDPEGSKKKLQDHAVHSIEGLVLNELRNGAGHAKDIGKALVETHARDIKKKADKWLAEAERDKDDDTFYDAPEYQMPGGWVN